MCRLLKVPRSSFYAWRNRVETPTAARRRELAEQVRRIFDESRQTSRCRRVAAQLKRDGREFTADQPGTRLVGDSTYLKTGEGWLYLATVIDLATGWWSAGNSPLNAHLPGRRRATDGQTAAMCSVTRSPTATVSM
jgi:putative transposase